MLKGKAVIIAGSRDFNNYDLLDRICEYALRGSENITIISGGARGADKLGEIFAKNHNHEVIVMNADWDKYGKSAGYRRNCDMAIEATKYEDYLCIAFLINNSRGTNNMIDICERYSIPCIKVEIVDDSPTGVVCTFCENNMK